MSWRAISLIVLAWGAAIYVGLLLFREIHRNHALTEYIVSRALGTPTRTLPSSQAEDRKRELREQARREIPALRKQAERGIATLNRLAHRLGEPND